MTKKTKVPRLDPRRTRKLTSRECCSVLGGFLGGMLTSDLVGVDTARQSLGVFLDPVYQNLLWGNIRKQAEAGAKETADAIDVVVEAARELQAPGGDVATRVYWRALGATIAGLRVLASEKAVKTAVEWLYRTDAWWPQRKEAEA